MSLTIRDVRIAYFGVEANMALLKGEAVGPLGALGDSVGYDDLFAKAAASQDDLRLPWVTGRPRANGFWRKYVTDRLQAGSEDGWPRIARGALVPLKRVVDLPLPQLLPKPYRRFSEVLAWQTGIGVSWNLWFKDVALSGADLIALVKAIWTGEVAAGPRGGGASSQTTFRKLYNLSLDRLLADLLGPGVTEDLRATPMIVITIVDGECPAGDIAAEREALLDGLKPIFNQRPAPLAGDARGGSGETVFVTPRLRLPWVPDAFRTKAEARAQGRDKTAEERLALTRFHRLGCLHRNLLQSSLQAEMIAQAMLRLSRGIVPGTLALPSKFFEPRKRLLTQRAAMIGNDGYKSPFVRQQLEDPAIGDAAKALGG